ncbi:tetratricopeptide repeat protein [Nonlabens sp.]|uniref:tetratricopeptide repeat protein n=1 Tax=Nonlabens sp. TaxID=1888209 RepID=UPI003F6A4108
MKKILFILIALCSAMGYGQDAFAKAESLYKIKKYEEAKPLFKALLQENQKDPKILRRLGDIESYAKRYKTAFPYYKMLLDLDQSNADAHFLYGGTLGLHAKNVSKLDALGYLDDIKHHLKEAANLDANHIETRWALVQLYCELPAIVGGSYKSSRQYADQLQKISPVDGYLAHGFIAEHDKEYRDAEKFYKKAIEVGGSLTTYRKLISLYEHKTREYLKALVLLQEAYATHKDPSLLEEIGMLKENYDLVGD